jgi:Flp pilus assembly protein TadD
MAGVNARSGKASPRSRGGATEEVPASQEKLASVCITLGLVGLVWLVFAQTLWHGFVNFDDDRYVYENQIVSRGLTWAGFVWVWGHAHASLWHPLTTLSHMLDCEFFGLRPAGHHLTNVLWHSVGAVLCFLVLRNMMRALWPSAFVASVFAIHPLRVESVAWISERKDVLSGVLVMLTLAAYTWYARNGSLRRYAVVAALYAAGVLAKATLVPLPFALLLLDYWPLKRATSLKSWRPLLIEKVPLLVVASVSSFATLYFQRGTMPSLAQLGLLPRIKNAIVSIVIYLRQTFWPVDLAIFYPHPHDQLGPSLVLACAALLGLITVVAILARRRYSYLFVGWFWFLLMLAPLLGLTQAGLQGHADRFTYLPHLGLSIAVAWGVRDFTGSWPHRQVVLGAGMATIVAALTFTAWRQTGYWRDNVTVWTRALAVTKDNQTAHQNLGAALWQQGDRRESARHTLAAATIHWQTYLRDDPYDVHARDELGAVLVQTGHVRDAVMQWQESLRFDPNDGNAMNNLAWVFATSPDGSMRNGFKAVELAEKAVALPGGSSPMVMRTLAAAQAEKGDFAAAAVTARQAASLAEAQQNDSLVATLHHEIELYEAATPYREAVLAD